MSVQLQRIPSEVGDERSQIASFKIVSYPADYTLQGLYDKANEDNIKIPQFQRQYVWTILQASRLIESFLLGLPVPGIFFYKEKRTGALVVIDGQQRLKSVFAYFDGSFPDSDAPFGLREVEDRWEGKLFSDLEKRHREQLRDSVLRATIVDQVDPNDNSSIFHIFERLNTGGTSLKPQEVRNCICSGPFNDLLIELNLNSDWRRILGTPHPDRRMRDVELILRFIALVKNKSQYSKPMKNFLSDFMGENRLASRQKLRRVRDLFEDTVQHVVESLGEKPFHISAGLNAAAYDAVMTAFASAKRSIPNDVKARYKRLIKNRSFNAWISSNTTDVDVVRKRIARAGKRLFE